MLSSHRKNMLIILLHLRMLLLLLLCKYHQTKSSCFLLRVAGSIFFSGMCKTPTTSEGQKNNGIPDNYTASKWIWDAPVQMVSRMLLILAETWAPAMLPIKDTVNPQRALIPRSWGWSTPEHPCSALTFPWLQQGSSSSHFASIWFEAP